MAKALITGITGQGGSFLAELLLSKGYKVYGLVRRSSVINTERITHILSKIELLNGDLDDEYSLVVALQKSKPDEVYNLAAQSFVRVSWEMPVLTGDITGLGVTRLLSAITVVSKGIRFLQASSSEMFGKVQEIPQKETTPFYPRSPYACSKAYAHWTTVNYRESYDMFASTAICFNYESERRGLEFVTRKITDGISKIIRGEEKNIRLGRIDVKRDWSHAKDIVNAMYMILQHDKPDDFVIASGENHTVQEFLEIAFGYCNLDWRDYVISDPTLFRPAEVETLLGDATKAKMTLGWEPKVKFRDLVNMMVEAELAPYKEKK